MPQSIKVTLRNGRQVTVPADISEAELDRLEQTAPAEAKPGLFGRALSALQNIPGITKAPAWLTRGAERMAEAQPDVGLTPRLPMSEAQATLYGASRSRRQVLPALASMGNVRDIALMAAPGSVAGKVGSGLLGLSSGAAAVEAGQKGEYLGALLHGGLAGLGAYGAATAAPARTAATVEGGGQQMLPGLEAVRQEARVTPPLAQYRRTGFLGPEPVAGVPTLPAGAARRANLAPRTYREATPRDLPLRGSAFEPPPVASPRGPVPPTPEPLQMAGAQQQRLPLLDELLGGGETAAPAGQAARGLSTEPLLPGVPEQMRGLSPSQQRQLLRDLEAYGGPERRLRDVGPPEDALDRRVALGGVVPEPPGGLTLHAPVPAIADRSGIDALEEVKRLRDADPGLSMQDALRSATARRVGGTPAPTPEPPASLRQLLDEAQPSLGPTEAPVAPAVPEGSGSPIDRLRALGAKYREAQGPMKRTVGAELGREMATLPPEGRVLARKLYEAEQAGDPNLVSALEQRLAALLSGESGAVGLQTLLRGGGAIAGGAGGASLGETPEQRIGYGLAGAAVGALAPDIVRRPADAFISSILSGPGTHAVNVVANAAKLGSEVGATGLGELMSRAGLRRGAAAVKPGETGALVRGIRAAAPEAKTAARRAVTTPATQVERGGTMLDISRPEFEGGGLNPLNWPRRVLGAEDVYFRRLAEGGRRAQARVNPALQNEQAIRDFAAQAVFQEKPDIFSQGLIDFKRKLTQRGADAAARGDVVAMVGNRVASQALDVAVPFIKTTSNIARQGVGEYSLVGAARGLSKGGREGTDLIAKGLLGTAASAVALYGATEIMGEGPQDPAHREELLKRGLTPNSIAIGDTVVPLRYFGPVGTALAGITTAMESYQDSLQGNRGAAEQDQTGTFNASIEAALRGLGSLATESYIGDVSLLASALKDPQRWLAVTRRRVAQGAVPFSALGRSVAGAVDPLRRRVATGAPGLDLASEVIPGATTALPVRRDIYGQPEGRPYLGEESGLGRLLRGVTGVSTLRPEDPVTAKALELEQATGVRVLPGFPNTTKVGQLTDLSPEEQGLAAEARGGTRRMLLEQLLANPRISNLPPEQLKTILKRVTDRASAAGTRRATGRIRQSRRRQ